jgi:ankyrin repeat protein
MSTSLPERPDLGQLRRQAKELRDAARRGDPVAAARFARHHPSSRPEGASLAAAQLVVARELGFPSWPKLKAAVEVAAGPGARVVELLAASIDGRRRRAADILQADPGIGSRDIRAAAMLGAVEEVGEMLAAEPEAAVAVDDVRGWPPLLYACYSRWHQIEASRSAGMTEVVHLLLSAGANPNTNDGGRAQYRSALKGSVEVNHPGITGALLAAGANPDPGQPIGEAIAHGDQRCLQLLLAHGARVAGTWALGAAVHHDNAPSMTLLLDALASAGGGAAEAATEALPDAAGNASLPLVAALLDAGADPGALDEDGVSALRHAVRAGRGDAADRLRAAGAPDDVTDVDRFIGACLNGDRPTVEELAAGHPDLRDRLTDQDHAVMVDAAASRPAETIALMLDAGFRLDARRFGDQPLHNAAYHGNAPAVRVLLGAGAEVDARDDRFDGTPLAFATVGSGEQSGRSGDWIGTVRLLIEAGASREDVWISEKPPSEEVEDLLRGYGITPDEPADPSGDDHHEGPASTGTGVLADIAVHLEAAYQHLDLDLLASLLHPDVRWTGVCRNSAQVIDWYRGLLADGTMPTVQSVEVDDDAVVLELSVSLRAEGARPAPPQHIYQVFTVDGAQIVDIRGYPDSASARARS